MLMPTLKVSVSDSSSEDESSPEGSEIEMEDDSSTDTAKVEKEVLMTNESWADSVTKILGTNKPKNKKTLVLSRAKKLTQHVKVEKVEKPSFEVIRAGDEIEEVKPIVKHESKLSVTSEPTVKKKKMDKPSIRVKPNILEKDRERLLTKIATKGVVQLFNAVRNQQKTLENEMERNDITETKKEKILKKFDKRAFLDTLMGQTKSINVDEETKTLKNEIKPEDEAPKWTALRDDFMMGAKMKDWDKESVDE